jgi:hypothetical protein
MAEFRHNVHFIMEEDGVCNTEVRKILKNFQVAQFRGTVHFIIEGDGVCNTTVRKMFVKNK